MKWILILSNIWKRKKEIGKNNAEVKENVKALGNVKAEHLDDNHNVVQNQTCYDSISGQIFRILKDQMNTAKFSEKKMQCILSNVLFNMILGCSWWWLNFKCTMQMLFFKWSGSRHHLLKEYIRINP